MPDPNYWSASGLIVDMVGVVLLANDLFKGHVREWIDERQSAYARAMDRNKESVVEQYRALRPVYTDDRIEELVKAAETHYEKLKAAAAAEAEQRRAAHTGGVHANQWRGVWFIVVGFLLQLIGTFAG